MRETKMSAVLCGECYNRDKNKIYESIKEGNQLCPGESRKGGFHSREDPGLHHFTGFLH